MSNLVWTRVGDNSIVSQIQLPTLREGNEYYLTDAWVGGAVDQTRRELVIGAAGGHGSWPGNEVYVWRANENPPRWHRTRTVTVTGGNQDVENGNGAYSDGQPSSTHSYHRPVVANGHFWLPGLDSVEGASGYWTTDTYSYDLSQNANGVWRRHGRLITTGSINKWLGGSSTYDPVTGKIFTVPQYGTTRWAAIDVPARLSGGDIAFPNQTPNTTIYNNFPSNPGYNIMVTAPDLRLVILLGTEGLWTMNPDNPAAGWTQRSMTGSPVSFQGGFVYHQASRACLGWASGGGMNLRRLNIPNPITGTWTWSNVATTGAVLPPSVNGHYGRWNIIDDMGNGQSALVYAPRYNTVGVYALKLPPGGV